MSGAWDGPIGDNEQALSRTDQPKFTAGDFFDCGRVGAQAFGLEGESAVLLLESGDGVGQLQCVAPRLNGVGRTLRVLQTWLKRVLPDGHLRVFRLVPRRGTSLVLEK